MKFVMPKLDVPKISSYLILIASTTTLSLFYGIWQLCENVLPNMDLDNCFSVWLQDLNFKFKYELLDDHLPSSLAVGVEAYQFPMPAYDIDNDCIAEVTRPIANALLIGASLGAAVSVLLCLVNNCPQLKAICSKNKESVAVGTDMEDEEHIQTPFYSV